MSGSFGSLDVLIRTIASALCAARSHEHSVRVVRRVLGSIRRRRRGVSFSRFPDRATKWGDFFSVLCSNALVARQALGSSNDGLCLQKLSKISAARGAAFVAKGGINSCASCAGVAKQIV